MNIQTQAPAVDLADRPFAQDAGESYTLPARYYTSPAVFEAEKEAIFYRSWIYVGHQSQVANAGEYLTAEILDQSVFVIRAKSGELNGFYNVCQHRGHRLVEGRGKTNLVVCPYHAWSFDHDGNLRAAPRTEGVENFDKCDFALKPVQVDIFCGMIFVNLDLKAPGLREQAPGLEEEILCYAPHANDMKMAEQVEYEPNANWKVLVDNFQECYHCSVAHKDFSELVDFSSKAYNYHSTGIYSSHCSRRTGSTDARAFKVASNDVEGYGGWFLWPNLTIWVYPGEEQLSAMQIIPLTPTTSREVHDWFTKDGTVSEQVRGQMTFHKDTLQVEDIALCEGVQKGLRSKGYNQGRFVVSKTESQVTEHGVHYFQKMVLNALSGAGLDN